MAGLAKKQTTADGLKAEIEQASIAVVVDYRGLTVAQLTLLRRELFKEKARFTVAKNTLMRRAVQGSDMEALLPALKGPTAVLMGRADQVAPVKAFTKFLKDNKITDSKIRGGVLQGQFLSPAAVEELANMPSLDELRGKLLGGIASPLNGMVMALSGPQRALVNVLDQLAKQKQG